jgi:hypothetical protein
MLRIDQQLRLQAMLDDAASPLDKLTHYADRHWPKADPAELFRRLGIGALLLPRVMTTLKMTTDQQAAMCSLVEQGLDEAESLQRQAQDDRRGNRRALLAEATGKLDVVKQQALALLTAEQRVQLGIAKN